MNTIDLSVLLSMQGTPIATSSEPPFRVQTLKKDSCVTELPKMYALSKTGSVRTYLIRVEDLGDHAVLTTSKTTTLEGKVTTDTYEYWEGVNIGKANETTYLEQALSEANSMWKKLLDAGFTAEIPDASQKFNTDANGVMKPMLAISFDERRIKFPCLCQPKYDGVRCTISEDGTGLHIISRKGKPYTIPHLEKWIAAHKEFLPLDGELYNHKELTFQEIVSAVKKVSDITDKIRYVVYDKPIAGVPNKKRWEDIIHIFEKLPAKELNEAPVYRSGWVYCNNMDDIKRYHKRCVKEGYEGIIIRNLDGEYEFGFRSNNLIKLKEFDDAEFEIIGIEEATGRDAGSAIFVLKTADGNEFRAKPQGTYELRSQYFKEAKKLIGKFATVQYQGMSDDGVPRFPSAISVRDYE